MDQENNRFISTTIDNGKPYYYMAQQGHKGMIRVRFAPSPTGPLHIGGVRTALYNFLFAKKYGGKVILRIEDTDRNRYVKGAEDYIKESLSWLGIRFDEGPTMGGDFGPYRQSERQPAYLQYGWKLVNEGHAYLAFDSEEALGRMRENLRTKKNLNPQYDSTTRRHMQNSLTLSEAETKAKLDRKDPFVIRLKTPENQQVTVQDLIRGNIAVRTAALDDKILIKSDGMPTYHLAHVVDDYNMHISHVIRGEEWLPSTPAHILIYKYMGWEHKIPAFAHLPLLLKPDGNGKLSKRDADRKGITILPITWEDPNSHEKTPGFREQGYLPESLVNFLALLGWNPGTSQELFTCEQLIQAFTLEQINKAGARFLFQKAKWFNQQHLRWQPSHQRARYLQEELTKRKIDYPSEKALQIVEVLKERVNFPVDFFNKGSFFFLPPTVFEPKIVAKVWDSTMRKAMHSYQKALKELTPFSESQLIVTLENIAASKALKKSIMMQAVRLALTGGAFGPDIATIMTILGKTETMARLDYARETLKNDL